MSTEEIDFTCVDHLVSNETFQVIPFKNGVLKTHPVPENLGAYYQSSKYISHSDSSSSIQDKIYQSVKSYMLSKKANWIKKYFRDGSILDFGCGTGEFLKVMKSRDWNVVGVEPNESARNLSNEKGIETINSLNDLKDQKFDVISLWHVLEHLPDQNEKLSSFFELLHEDGLLIIAVPNYNSYDAKIYKEEWAAWDVPRHLYHFSRNGIKEHVENFGFSLVSEKPLKFDSYYVSLLSEKNAGAGNPIRAFKNGLKSNLKAYSTKEYSSLAYFFKKV